MSTYMVQENHQRKLNTLLFQYVIPLYFSWIILDHPVVESCGGFYNESSRKPLKFTKTQKVSKSKEPQLSNHVQHLGSIIKRF